MDTSRRLDPAAHRDHRSAASPRRTSRPATSRRPPPPRTPSRRRELDHVVFATMNPAYYFPGSGASSPRARSTTTPALDIRQQCAGFLSGLQLADAFIRSGRPAGAVVGAEGHAAFFPWAEVVGRPARRLDRRVDRKRRLGSAAPRPRGALRRRRGGGSCARLTRTERSGVHRLPVHTDGTEGEDVGAGRRSAPFPTSRPRWTPSAARPDRGGREVFRTAATPMPAVVREVLDRERHDLEDLDLLLMHQANLRINEAVQKQLGLPDERSSTTSRSTATRPRRRSPSPSTRRAGGTRETGGPRLLRGSRRRPELGRRAPARLSLGANTDSSERFVSAWSRRGGPSLILRRPAEPEERAMRSLLRLSSPALFLVALCAPASSQETPTPVPTPAPSPVAAAPEPSPTPAAPDTGEEAPVPWKPPEGAIIINFPSADTSAAADACSCISRTASRTRSRRATSTIYSFSFDSGAKVGIGLSYHARQGPGGRIPARAHARGLRGFRQVRDRLRQLSGARGRPAGATSNREGLPETSRASSSRRPPASFSSDRSDSRSFRRSRRGPRASDSSCPSARTCSMSCSRRAGRSRAASTSRRSSCPGTRSRPGRLDRGRSKRRCSGTVLPSRPATYEVHHRGPSDHAARFSTGISRSENVYLGFNIIRPVEAVFTGPSDVTAGLAATDRLVGLTPHCPSLRAPSPAAAALSTSVRPGAAGWRPLVRFDGGTRRRRDVPQPRRESVARRTSSRSSSSR